MPQCCLLLCSLQFSVLFLCRDMFDIAPRSNLNVRVREYVPSAITSAPQRLERLQSATHSVTSAPRQEQQQVSCDSVSSPDERPAAPIPMESQHSVTGESE